MEAVVVELKTVGRLVRALLHLSLNSVTAGAIKGAFLCNSSCDMVSAGYAENTGRP